VLSARGGDGKIMRLVTFIARDHKEPRVGAVVDQRVIDLQDRWSVRGNPPGPAPCSLRHLLELGEPALAHARALVADGDHQASHPLADVTVLPPIPSPDKFICVGKNYRTHLEELRRNDLLREQPTEPTGFIKVNSCLIGHEGKVKRPAGITMMDYEPELVFVIGKRAHGVRQADALRHIVGVTMLNDLTAREIQKREVAAGTRFWTAKNMPGFGPLGPYLVTLDELADPLSVWVTLSVNGKQRMRVNTADQIFKIDAVIEHFSRYVPLLPGDLFSTGAPGGVAIGQANAAELFLKPGDVVDVALEGVMTLRTHIIEDDGK
jgi:2-keto-4-pentenoate hydratase/2-oxohepta-3-ene-1,7-dioic acid hydratase in catechol pathway